MSKMIDNAPTTYLQEISQLILEQKETLSNSILEDERFNYKHAGNNKDRLQHLRFQLIQLYGETIPLPLSITAKKLKDWGRDYADIFVSLNIPLDHAIEEVHFYRNKIGLILKKAAKNEELDLDTFYELISGFDLVVDTALQMVSTSYMEKYISNLRTAEEEIDELSVPVVLLGDGIGILPMIGDIDTKRAQFLMDNALKSSVDLGLNNLILDLSGVPIIDTMVAQKIYQVIQALELIGVETKISGLRPELALTMTSLGVEFSGIKTFSSLHLALQHLGFKRTTN
ncbi:rsbT co-antagonist protein RsbR [Fictibacillus solisalsi]|uniref:RsbT co-antagonist protein RsbR n=1 Tax=Fictibacillus solisalsi TaxID=459525 RepID=A0A1G9TK97_9BACL|nr:STAS domain-containing protein [Fictibacillus solisalsi]SDM48196.1 rsbT co-antagonist protein RsbR [Fictibacillus solisalsi]